MFVSKGNIYFSFLLFNNYLATVFRNVTEKEKILKLFIHCDCPEYERFEKKNSLNKT